LGRAIEKFQPFGTKVTHWYLIRNLHYFFNSSIPLTTDSTSSSFVAVVYCNSERSFNNVSVKLSQCYLKTRIIPAQQRCPLKCLAYNSRVEAFILSQCGVGEEMVSAEDEVDLEENFLVLVITYIYNI
jgi:hypothetical protein